MNPWFPSAGRSLLRELKQRIVQRIERSRQEAFARKMTVDTERSEPWLGDIEWGQSQAREIERVE